MLSKEVLGNIVKFYGVAKESNSTSHMQRSIGVMEGIMLANGVLIPGQPFEYKNIEVVEFSWFGKKKLITRKETYHQHVIRLFNEFIETVKE